MKGITQKSTIALLVMAGLGLSHSAFALDRSINIIGKVVASECVTDVVGNNGNTVNLGTVQGADLLKAGSDANETAFSIKFSDCPATTKGYKATFSGDTDPVDNMLFKNSTDAGSAQNVQVVVTNTDAGGDNVLKNGGTYVAPNSLSGGGVLNLKAKAHSREGNATPGNINSTVLLTVEFTG
ncbi:TPA: hypothetical protein QDZ66_001638 [Pluralibacter gergoviae]|uniref:Fimbrial-type adhesion domain-containing protein n=1 Tax=Pluralibacter gergoviae TaxID=61647 RepID=A0A0F0VJ27_PLUGE|nr:fimbrial protein [Pluralibacter gergoviae]KJM60734.1 hypothetical protein SS31_18205 [Pluralibacter gergoviae]KMK14749.1 hypothetical protein ABW06_07910 [Pluralibacter gergoviae]KMK26622.1 hypothetical protein ABW10_04045 [Pluralibacter gergoviae]MBL3694008.1 hypothetical protein [Pluralibacter gergoviae]OUQ90569.1 hypothetical protein B5M10_26050 [Pluralibacter gergoviae]